ncbi:MAG: 23S rRNA (guanosine(2251)-2'-O)-methyltransferase RlmB [Anaerolineae bacterium]|nr:23S rRNA (guanosine(2251)-2'-O)-methyltransferase RlmB [Anaerolineae bacterium]
MSEFLYGRNPIYECLHAGRRGVTRLLVAEGSKEKGTLSEVVRLAQHKRIPIQHAEHRQLDKLAPSVNHQGVLAEVAAYPYVEIEAMLAAAREGGEAPLLLLLDCLQDPQNLGTLLRTAEVVGVHGVILPDRRSVSITPAVVNASSGACEHLRIAQIINLVQTMQSLKAENVWIAGLEDAPEAQTLWSADLRGPTALVVGSEGSGMRRLVRETCDFMVRLPMFGQINSLNAAVAGSIALYEITRQRGK